MLKTTAKTLVGGIALAVIFSAKMASAGPLGCTLQTGLGAAVVGQSAPANNSPEGKMRQNADLLHRARQAMAENDLAAADSLISQAEALDLQYNVLYMGDTPKKARRDLQRKRDVSGATPPSPARCSPRWIEQEQKIKRERSVRRTDRRIDRRFVRCPASHSAAEGGRRQSDPLALRCRRSPMQPPQDPSFRIREPGENEVSIPTGKGPLQAARLALAVGDTRRAAELLQQAKAMRINYQPLDDTPDRVEGAIRKYQDLSTLDKNTEAYRRAYARNMMEQADSLLRWGEQDEAERLAGRAAGMQVVYGPFEQKPQDLLERIGSMRRQAGARQIAPPPSAPASGASPAPLPTIATRSQAVDLVRQSREAIAAGQLDRAESLARQAELLRLPDSAFAPGEDRPGLVLLDLRQLRASESSSVLPAAGQYAASAGSNAQLDRAATRAVYDPANDPTRNMPTSSQELMNPNLRMAQNPNARPPVPAVPPLAGSDWWFHHRHTDAAAGKSQCARRAEAKPVDGRRDGGAATGARPANRRRSCPPGIQCTRLAQYRSQGRSGPVGRSPKEGRNVGPG